MRARPSSRPARSSADSRLLQDYLIRSAERRPDAPVIVMGAARWTYGQLDAATSQLAHLLLHAGCRPGDRVCLMTPKTPFAILSELAALKAGLVYVPMDTASPAPRIEMILQAAEPSAILVAGSVTALLDEVVERDRSVGRVIIGSLEEGSLEGGHFQTTFSRSDWAAYPSDAPVVLRSAAEAAHLLFTSGSTGVPKGVVITHANAVAFVEWGVRYFGYTSEDRLSGHPPLHFDLSTFDIYGTLAAGACLFPVPGSINLLPTKLVEFIANNQLTQWFSVPSVLTYLANFDSFAPETFSSLRRVLWCGDVLPTPTLIHWMQRLPGVTFTNLYGPTEATIASSYYTVPACPASETDPIPIGVACAGEELLVLNERLEPVAAGEIGDLFIAGVGLSPGYWRDEEKTNAAFLSDSRPGRDDARIYRTGDLAYFDENGLIHFVGRADSQVKSRGYRIELGEIEAAVNALKELRECAVVGVPVGGFEGTMICCAYAPSAGEHVEPTDVRSAIAKILPAYMLPSRWMVLDELPKNQNGKIDRTRVRDSFQAELDAASELVSGIR
jgi:amino acid adenylation domain-containing protein